MQHRIECRIEYKYNIVIGMRKIDVNLDVNITTK